MPLVSGGVKYFRTTEAARSIGISRSTLLRWLSQGRVEIPVKRDRNGWRVFTDEDIALLKDAAEHIEETAL
jgi:excisionase family DNA binding protein